MKKLFVACIMTVVLVFGLWIVAVPRSLLPGLIADSFRDSPVTVDVVDLQKGLFYNVRIRQVVFKKSGSTLLSIDNASCRFAFSSLFRLKPGITFRGELAGGAVRGTLYLSRKGRSLDFLLENAHMEELPFLSQAGVSGSGLISGEYRALNDRGNVKFTVEKADFRPASLGGVPVPLNMFKSARGAMETNGKMLRIVSFTMEGKGIYARIKGHINGGMLNLIIEIMPDASLEGQNMMFSMIRRYEVSPGHYSIPIRSSTPF